jgi:3'-phosphoadenosine 5'-phosphosulfate (PAPS) 3'-phosphatase
MTVILIEAGAMITDISGKPLVFNQEETLSPAFVASNGKSHQALLELIAQ